MENEENERYQKAIEGVETDIEIVPSALKHGKTMADILSVLERAIYDETLTADPNKTLAVGFDTNANLTEIIFLVLAEGQIVVYHAMPCRKMYMEKAISR